MILVLKDSRTQINKEGEEKSSIVNIGSKLRFMGRYF